MASRNKTSGGTGTNQYAVRGRGKTSKANISVITSAVGTNKSCTEGSFHDTICTRMENTFYGTAGLLIRRARLAAGLSQAALAKRAGVSRPTIARYEGQTIDPPAGVFLRVLAAAGYDFQIHNLNDLAQTPSHKSELWVREHQVSSFARSVALYLKSGSEPDAQIELLNLLDVLRGVSAEDLQKMISQSPKFVGDRRYDAWIAALVEHFCAKTGVVVPEWSQDKRRFQKPPWQPTSFHHLDDPLTQCPTAFMRHGILIHASELERA